METIDRIRIDKYNILERRPVVDTPQCFRLRPCDFCGSAKDVQVYIKQLQTTFIARNVCHACAEKMKV